MILKNIWQGYWARHYSHEYGMCYPDHKNKKFYVNIPKNATNWGKMWALANDFRPANYHTDQLLEKEYQPIVFLRNPLDRWYTGIAEWISRYQVFHPNYRPSEEVLSVLLERVAFDTHTEEQIMFLENIDIANCVFFRVDDNLIKNFRHYVEHELGQDPYMVPETKQYQSAVAPKGISSEQAQAHAHRKRIKEQLQECVANSIYNNINGQKDLCEKRLMDYYRVDFQLYNSVQYYIKGEE